MGGRNCWQHSTWRTHNGSIAQAMLTQLARLTGAVSTVCEPICDALLEDGDCIVQRIIDEAEGFHAETLSAQRMQLQWSRGASQQR